jgi:ferric-dicitrate binding protein FerR (iron transport regulator)
LAIACSDRLHDVAGVEVHKGNSGLNLVVWDSKTSVWPGISPEEEMFLQSQVRYVFPGAFGCLLLFSPALYAFGEQALGLVRFSHAASLGGVPVPGSIVIFDSDLLSTSTGGNALVELHSGTIVQMAENSSVRFVRDGEIVRVDLISGAVVSEGVGKADIVMTTPKYQFAPAQDESYRYLVQLSKEQAIVAAAMKGNVIVKPRKTNARYVLHEGSYAAIPATAVGVPGQSGGTGGRPEAGHAGTVLNVIQDSVVQRQGRGVETVLKVGDAIDTGDIITTKQNGRLRVVLSDGSLLNIGPGSSLKIVRFELQPPQTQVELTSGRMRVRAVQPSQSSSSRTVQTPTAMVWVGPDLIIEAHPNATTVLSIEGAAAVANIDPAITQHVIVSAGKFTDVAGGRAPSDPQSATNSVLQSQMDQTRVGLPEPGGPGAVMSTPQEGWHIDDLSPDESLGVIVGTPAVLAATIAALALASPSPSAP